MLVDFSENPLPWDTRMPCWCARAWQEFYFFRWQRTGEGRHRASLRTGKISLVPVPDGAAQHTNVGYERGSPETYEYMNAGSIWQRRDGHHGIPIRRSTQDGRSCAMFLDVGHLSPYPPGVQRYGINGSAGELWQALKGIGSPFDKKYQEYTVERAEVIYASVLDEQAKRTGVAAAQGRERASHAATR